MTSLAFLTENAYTSESTMTENDIMVELAVDTQFVWSKVKKEGNCGGERAGIDGED